VSATFDQSARQHAIVAAALDHTYIMQEGVAGPIGDLHESESLPGAHF
jgi:hypothetical protein